MKIISTIPGIFMSIFRRRKQLPVPLGRWKLTSNSYEIYEKLDRSNYDHCGPCGNIQIYEEKTNKQSKLPAVRTIRKI